MSKDRYSTDHTIQIVGDTETLNVVSNLDVSENLDVGGDITVVGTIVTPSIDITGGDLTIDDDLTVTGTATITNLVVTNTAERSAAETICFNFPASAFVPMGDWSLGFTHQVDSAGDGVEVQAGDSLGGSHSLAMLPNGCTIEALRIRYTPQAASGYTVSASIVSRGKTLGNVATVATVTDTAGSDGIFNVASTTGIGEVINTTLFSYWVIFDIDAPGADTLELHEVNVDCEVTDYS